jgi:hypothetical protein
MSEHILTRKHHTHPHAASSWRIHCGVEVTELSTNKQHTHQILCLSQLSPADIGTKALGEDAFMRIKSFITGKVRFSAIVSSDPRLDHTLDNIHRGVPQGQGGCGNASPRLRMHRARIARMHSIGATACQLLDPTRSKSHVRSLSPCAVIMRGRYSTQEVTKDKAHMKILYYQTTISLSHKDPGKRSASEPGKACVTRRHLATFDIVRPHPSLCHHRSL